MNHQLKIKNNKSGFSLFELLVVMAIVAIVTTVTFTNFPKMNGKLALDLLTEDIAITLRQAQIYGTTVFGAGTLTNGAQVANYNAYGVSFPDPAIFTADENYTYTLFVDIPSMGGKAERYNENAIICSQFEKAKSCVPASVPCGNPTGTNECFQRFKITGRDKIKGICSGYNFASDDVKTNATACLANPIGSKTSADILYTRPSLQATLQVLDESNNLKSSLDNIAVIITNEEETEWRAVVAWNNGQIAIDK